MKYEYKIIYGYRHDKNVIKIPTISDGKGIIDFDKSCGQRLCGGFTPFIKEWIKTGEVFGQK